jgi:ribosomal protein S18 acetylase RimI-like enzyme
MIELKLLTEEDLSFLLEVRNDDSTRFYLEDDSIFTLDECKKWFVNLNSPWYIIETIEGNKVGYIRTNGDEIGCDIHPKFRRKGYAKMAYKEYLKDKKYASLKVFKDNFAINLYKKLGFVEIGKGDLIRGREYVNMIFRK